MILIKLKSMSKIDKIYSEGANYSKTLKQIIKKNKL